LNALKAGGLNGGMTMPGETEATTVVDPVDVEESVGAAD